MLPERQPIEKAKAEDKYKKPIFVLLLELLLIAIYSSLLFVQPAYCQAFVVRLSSISFLFLSI